MKSPEQKADIQFVVDTGLRAKSGALQIEDIHFGYRDDQHVLQRFVP